jgi:hypothetical protein
MEAESPEKMPVPFPTTQKRGRKGHLRYLRKKIVVFIYILNIFFYICYINSIRNGTLI